MKKLLPDGRVFRDEFELGPLSRWRERERVRVVSARHYVVSNLAPLTLSLSPHEAWGERGTMKDWLHSSSVVHVAQQNSRLRHVVFISPGPGRGDDELQIHRPFAVPDPPPDLPPPALRLRGEEVNFALRGRTSQPQEHGLLVTPCTTINNSGKHRELDAWITKTKQHHTTQTAQTSGLRGPQLVAKNPQVATPWN